MAGLSAQKLQRIYKCLNKPSTFSPGEYVLPACKEKQRSGEESLRCPGDQDLINKNLRTGIREKQNNKTQNCLSYTTSLHFEFLNPS